MEIDCEKCRARYAVDEARLTPATTQSRCPRCRHQQPLPGRQSRGAEGAGKTPASAPVTEGAPTEALSRDDLMQLLAKRAAKTGAAGAAASSGGAASDASTKSEEPGRSEAGDPGESRPIDGMDLFQLLEHRESASGSPRKACVNCGRPIADPFDLALGQCDSCRNRGRSPPPVPDPDPSETSGATSGGPAQRASEAAIGVAAPPTLKELPRVELPEPGAPHAEADARGDADAGEPREAPALDGNALADLAAAERAASATFDSAEERHGHPQVNLATVKGGGFQPGAGSPLFSSASEADRDSSGTTAKLLFFAGTLLLAFLLVWLLPDGKQPVLPELKQVLPAWRLSYVELPDSTDGLDERGAAALARGDATSLTEAEEAFQQSLLIDPSSREALVGYLVAVARGREGRLGADLAAETLSIAEALQLRDREDPRTTLALAEVVLARPAPARERAAALAREVLERDAPRDVTANARLIMAQALLAAQPGRALELAREAEEGGVPALRSRKVAARAQVALGRYEQVAAEIDAIPDQTGRSEVREALVGLLVAGNRPGRAAALFEGVEGLAASVRRAELRYLEEGDEAALAEAIEGAIADASDAAVGARAEALAALAAAHRLAGRSAQARDAADRALALVDSHPAANLQRALVALEAIDARAALAHLASATGALGRGEQTLLEATALLIGGEARDVPARLAPLDGEAGPWIPVTLLKAAAAVGVGERERALDLALDVLPADPTRLEPEEERIAYRVDLRHTLGVLRGRFASLATGASDVAPHVAEGILLRHLGDSVEAGRIAGGLLRRNHRDPALFTLGAFASLDRGRSGPAEAMAQEALKGDASSAPAQLALGLARLSRSDFAPARAALVEARKGLPSTLLLPRVGLAELDAELGRAEEARTELREVLTLDPGYGRARRALLALEASAR